MTNRTYSGLIELQQGKFDDAVITFTSHLTFIEIKREIDHKTIIKEVRGVFSGLGSLIAYQPVVDIFYTGSFITTRISFKYLLLSRGHIIPLDKSLYLQGFSVTSKSLAYWSSSAIILDSHNPQQLTLPSPKQIAHVTTSTYIMTWDIGYDTNYLDQLTTCIAKKLVINIIPTSNHFSFTDFLTINNQLGTIALFLTNSLVDQKAFQFTFSDHNFTLYQSEQPSNSFPRPQPFMLYALIENYLSNFLTNVLNSKSYITTIKQTQLQKLNNDVAQEVYFLQLCIVLENLHRNNIQKNKVNFRNRVEFFIPTIKTIVNLEQISKTTIVNKIVRGRNALAHTGIASDVLNGFELRYFSQILESTIKIFLLKETLPDNHISRVTEQEEAELTWLFMNN